MNKRSRLPSASVCLARSLLLAACGVLLHVFPAHLYASEIQINSQRLEYDESSHYMVATGSVTVNWKDKLLTANTVYFAVDRQLITAEGAVTLTEKENVLRGDTIVYDYKASTGTIVNARGGAYPWFFLAEKAARTSETRYETGKVALTTCDLPRPHYIIRATRAKITLNKRITIFNPVFYLRNVPIFYLPFFTSTLGGGRKDSLEIQPGYNSDDGLIIRTIYGYPITEHMYGKLYLDFFSKRGWGTGAEFGYVEENKVKGTLYGYHIKEDNTGIERWNLRAGYWQKLNLLWTLQANADFVSDSNFNNNYFLANWQRVNQQLHSFVAATRQDSKSSFRVLAERYDVLYSTSSPMEPSVINLPAVSYTRYPQRFKNGIYNNLSLNVQNQYLRARNDYAITAYIDDNITRDYTFGRKLTVKPRLGLQENWQNRVVVGNTADNTFNQYFTAEPAGTVINNVFITRYYATLGLRYRLLRWIDWDLTYDYRLRTEPNSLLIDYGANDFGEERNLLSFVNSMYLNRLTVRNTLGYDIHANRNDKVVETVNDNGQLVSVARGKEWYERFTPFINELTWTHPYPLQVYVRTENIISPYTMKSIQSDARFGDPEKRYVQLGVFYQSYRPDDLDFVTGFGLWPSEKWKLDYIIRTTESRQFSSLTVTDQEIRVYRDLHCWQARVAFRRRFDVYEFFFQIELKTSADKRRNLESRSVNQEFYPWR